MKEDSRKKRIEKILKKNFSPKILFIRDDSKKHEGHTQIEENSIETHFFIRMTLDNNNSMNPTMDGAMQNAINYFNDFLKSARVFKQPSDNERDALVELVRKLELLDEHWEASEIQKRAGKWKN